MVDNQHRHDAMKKLPMDSWFRWRCDDPSSLEAWGMELERSLSFLDAPREVVDALPWYYRLIVRFAPLLMRRRVDGYRINRYRFR